MHRARRRFGQNFLIDPDIIQAIVSVIAPCNTDKIIEIGPGLGALTKPLLNKVEHLEVIELDRDLIRNLETLNNENNKVTIYSVDALKFDFSCTDQPRRIVGNLPYNISTPLIFHLLDKLDCIIDMHFMLQREVVDRICAVTGDRNFGRLSVMVQAKCLTQNLIPVSAKSFSPIPKVESAFLRLIPHKIPLVPIELESQFKNTVRACFAQPRKTIANNLKNILSHDQISNANIDPAIRPQNLTLENLLTITKLNSP